MLAGFEIEVAGLSRDSLRTKIRPAISSQYHIDFHDDGSIRRYNYAINDTPVIPISVNGRDFFPVGAERIDHYGPEIVTRPYDKHGILELAGELGEALCKIPENSRASIHVHVSGFKTWEHIQRLIWFMYTFEAPMFRISALGGRHRGELSYDGNPNDYRYCRPLSNPIHIVTRDGMKRVPLINIDGILDATSFGEMLKYWGRLDYFWNEGGLQHYCPHRLHCINIAPLLRHQTVEFRLFNGVPKYLQDVLALVIRIYELTEDWNYSREPMLLGTTPDFTANEFSEILGGMDITHLWGNYWPKGVVDTRLLSHYNHHNEVISTSRSVYTCNWLEAPSTEDDDD